MLILVVASYFTLVLSLDTPSIVHHMCRVALLWECVCNDNIGSPLVDHCNSAYPRKYLLGNVKISNLRISTLKGLFGDFIFRALRM